MVSRDVLLNIYPRWSVTLIPGMCSYDMRPRILTNVALHNNDKLNDF